MLDSIVACSRLLFNPKSIIGGANGERISESLDAYSKLLFVPEPNDGGTTGEPLYNRPQLAWGGCIWGETQLHAVVDLNWL